MRERLLSNKGLASCQRQSLLSHEEKMTGFNPLGAGPSGGLRRAAKSGGK